MDDQIKRDLGEIKLKQKGVNFTQVIGESSVFVGKTVLDIAKTGAFFMAFYMLWAYFGCGLVPLILGIVAVGLVLYYVGMGIAGYGWNPMTQANNRLQSETKSGFNMPFLK